MYSLSRLLIWLTDVSDTTLGYVLLLTSHFPEASLFRKVRGRPILRSSQCLQRQTKIEVVEHQALQFPSQHFARVTHRQRRLLDDQARQLPGARQQFVTGKHFRHEADLLGFARADLLSSQ